MTTQVKLFLLLNLFLSMKVVAQENAYSFINFKITQDSLQNIKFNPKVTFIDTSDFEICEIISLVAWLGFKDTTESLWKEREEAPLKYQKICEEDISNIKNQIRLNNSTKEHNLEKITTTENIYIIPSKKRKRKKFLRNKNSYGYFTISNPIFTKDKKIAFVWVNLIEGFMYAEGYIEIYIKNNDGKWEQIAQYKLWHS